MSTLVLFIALCGLAGAAGGASLSPRTRVLVASLLTSAASALALIVAIRVLATRHDVTWSSARLLPFTGVTLALTPFGALFVITTGVISIFASLYWFGYARHVFSSRGASTAMALFVTAMLLVPFAGSVATFLVLWELMALASLALVLNDHARREEVRSAGLWYAVMTHAGGGAILLSLVLLSTHAGGQAFSSIAAHSGQVSEGVRSVVFLLAVAGFASKAGAAPLHVWLPKAHAEAPAPASALMSGAMVNLGVYGIVLVGNRLLGGGAAWWWLVVSAFGVLSALYGALYAATSTDLKRLLAYSTTDNMGLVLIGVGAAGLLAANGQHRVAALAMMAALLILVNHAVFKSALFLAAGSVQTATHGRDLDRMGGLLSRMPVTGTVFLVGALSVSALPPLNGFVGEWLLFQSLVHAIPTSATAVVLAVSVGVAALALAGGLTIVAFVKAMGIGFLGRPRSDEAAAAREVPVTMRAGAVLLAAGCVALGVAPMLALPAVTRAAGAAIGSASPAPHGWVALHLAGLSGQMAPVLLAAALLVGTGLAAALRRGRARLARRAVEPWGSGRELQTARMQYTATSYGEPLQRVFDDVIRPDHDLAVSHAAESRYYVEKIAYRTNNDDVVERVLYRPLGHVVGWWARAARHLANGSVHRYLGYGLAALIVILVALT